MAKSPAEIREIRALHPKMRERDFARIHGISEAELTAAYVGENVVRLKPDVAVLLAGLPACGEVMALTRNESAVHEKIGPYENAKAGANSAIVLGDEIDLRIFPSKWVSGFAVEKSDGEGGVRRSVQFFDVAGDAVHKVHTRPATNLEAWNALVESLRSEDQSQLVEIGTVPDVAAVDASAAASPEELLENWSRLTDTHQFFGMLKKLNLERLQAMRMIGDNYAWPLDPAATAQMMNGAAASSLPIMVFVGNAGCIQIHGGPIARVEPMGPWLNVLDETFHLHLRLDHIAEVWAVRKPTADGHVTSVECYGADQKLIIQFFGKRVEGHDERPEWRALVESLPVLQQSTAA
ncbi:hemin-degrading factor [Youhaiella tibetensis]|nr:hemin-degrading factor [Youhaiella tibetensis]AKR54566.1 Hemin transport protein HmuS [Devosia sp. H5989]GGF30902.1 hemin-degrading factor [Youhaiella tibetensis]